MSSSFNDTKAITLPLTASVPLAEQVEHRAGSMSRVVILDCLRFVAAAAVFLQHSLEQRGELGGQVVGYLSPGVFGVALFFLISGFIIPMASERSFNLKTFVIRRIFRIYPLVIASFIVVGLVAYTTDIPDFVDVRSARASVWLANLLLIQDYVNVEPILGVTWTLSLEFAWYGLFALAVISIGRRFDDWLVIIAPCFVLLLILASFWLQHRLPSGRINMIYLAIMGCRVYRYYSGALTARRLANDAVIFLAVSTLSNAIAFGYFRHPHITMMQAIAPWTAATVLFFLVFTVPKIRDSAFMSSSILVWLGMISFSAYLLHPLALGFANTYTTGSISFLVGVLGTILLAYAGYHLIEVPGHKLGHRLTRPKPETDASRRAP
jgi:peptidoglycan/LPS O-acetylase OafA/YrhL